MDARVLYASAYRPSELEKYHEGLIVCSACLGGEVPKRITAGQFAEAEEAIQWYKNLFGDDYYLEMQRHRRLYPVPITNVIPTGKCEQILAGVCPEV